MAVGYFICEPESESPLDDFEQFNQLGYGRGYVHEHEVQERRQSNGEGFGSGYEGMEESPHSYEIHPVPKRKPSLWQKVKSAFEDAFLPEQQPPKLELLPPLKPKPLRSMPRMVMLPNDPLHPDYDLVPVSLEQSRTRQEGEGRAATAQGIEMIRRGLTLVKDNPPEGMAELYREYRALEKPFRSAAKRSRR
jgi:hypothetical protein